MRSSTMAAAPLIFFAFLAILFLQQAQAHNITHILASHPSFSTFNEYLTKTHLADEINRRQTITVCALDNAAMSEITSKGYPIYTIRNILSFHVIVDYYGAKKLHQISNGTTLSSTMFQETGAVSGNSGYVNITNLSGGKVGLMPADDRGTGKFNSFFVKSLFESPYNISVIQLSQPLSSPEAAAPTPEPSSLNLTSLLSSKGCKSFASLLESSGAIETYLDNLISGLTVFCPGDAAIAAFMPKYKNLTAANQTTVLLYHGLPFYNSLGMLRSNNGAMNTLATNGGVNKYAVTVQNDGEEVTVKTKVVTAKVTGTLAERDPLGCFKLNKVLLPSDLFKKVKETEAPAPAPEAKAPKGSLEDDEGLAPEPDSVDDSTADDEKNGARKVGLSGGVVAVVGLVCGMVAFM